jgi:N-acetylmuramoyl-L-alanine amidase
MPLTPHAIAGRIFALALLSCLLFAPVASGEEQKIDVTRNGVTTTLVLPEYTSQGVPYASLADLARQLGGTAEVDAARAAMQLGETRAEVGLNDVAVQRGGESFSLIHPVLPYQNDALIAMSDVVRFLRDGYGMGTPENPPATSALALPAEEAPLESVVPEAPSTRPLPESELMEVTELESIAPTADTLEDAPLESVAPASVTPDPMPSGIAVVAIDPGHGGDDTGVVGSTGLAEKDVCLAIATSVSRVLSEKYGVSTVLTREGDEIRTAQNRADALSSGRAGLVVSIHVGASYATGAAGPALFAHAAAGASRASLSVARFLSDSVAGISAPSIPVVHEAALGLLRGSTIPGVLVEVGNLANPTEEARLADPQYQEQLAAALAGGINQALGRPEPGGAAQ